MDRAVAAHCAGGQLSGGLVRIVTAAPAAAAFSNAGRTAFTWNSFRDGLTIRMSLAAPFRSAANGTYQIPHRGRRPQDLLFHKQSPPTPPKPHQPSG